MNTLIEQNEQIQRAILFMKNAHRGQTRRDGETPYWNHPMRVAKLLAKTFLIGETQTVKVDAIIVALLHDVLEDTSVIYEILYHEFGATVAGMVDLLSKPGPDTMYFRHKRYIARLAQSSKIVQIIKWADIMDNLRDLNGTDKGFKKFMTDRAEAYAIAVLEGAAKVTILQEVTKIKIKFEESDN